MYPKQAEKRAYRRYTVEGVNGNMVFAAEARILNLSEGGAALEVEKRMNIGNNYTLKLEDNGHLISVRGTVVWASITHARHTERGETVPIYNAGLQFNPLTADQYRELRDFLARHKIAPKKRLGSLRFIIGGDHSAVVSYPFIYEVKELSLGGILIQSNQSFDEGVTFPMEIFLNHHVPISFSGRITACHDKKEGGRNFFAVGIAFEGMDDRAKINLEEFLKLLEDEKTH